MSDFLEALRNTLLHSDSNLSVTENGALGRQTTGKALLDFNFAVSSMRKWPDSEISVKFADVCAENIDLAVVWLFFARDVRQGMGERRLFRVCLRYLADHYPEITDKVLPLIAEYGRWDDLFEVFETKVHDKAIQIVCDQLVEDLNAAKNGGSVSLLAKWLPTINSHNWKTRSKALRIAGFIGLNRFEYQKCTSRLRKRIHLVESQMSAGQWGEIDYAAVPSKANLIYKDAFFRHDEERRKAFLEQVKEGKTKINASVAFPHEIVAKYNEEHFSWASRAISVDDTLEAMWKALPDFVADEGSTLVVADGSGSMTIGIGDGNASALDVANGLAIYFAERLKGVFHNTYITFSSKPQIVKLGDGTLASKLTIALKHDECSNTNIEAVFNLILNAAVHNGLKQEDLPRNVLVISDMEFDVAVDYRSRSETLFDTIAARYEAKGLRLPRLVFWNVCSRTNTIPVIENPNGVALVSGFSPAIAKMVLSGEIDPYKVLLETLTSERYAPVWQAIAP